MTGSKASAPTCYEWEMHSEHFHELFAEYLQLAGEAGWSQLVDKSRLKVGPGDCLVVVDMQNDFVPIDAENPHGGAFAVPEGNGISNLVVQLIEEFANKGGVVVATRDYHPKGHCSFIPDGPFPAHCVQGSVGSAFYSPIGEALTLAKAAGKNVHIVFKGFHEDIDSFGSFAYPDTDDSFQRVSNRKSTFKPCASFGNCSLPDWTGCAVLDCSNLEADINAPPDVLATRREVKLKAHLEKLGVKRVFACGLAMDYCVLDTCLNGISSGFSDMTMILDACRAAHLPGCGAHGSGFLSDPAVMMEKMKAAKVKLSPAVSLLPDLKGIACSPFQEREVPKSRFPECFGPYALVRARQLELLVKVEQRSYKALGPVDVIRLFEGQGIECRSKITPLSTITLDDAARKKAGIPDQATQFCWAYPIGGGRFSEHQRAYLPTTSPSASFFVFGGFIYFGKDNSVVSVTAMTLGKGLEFKPAQKLSEEFSLSLLETTYEKCPQCLASLANESNYCGNCGIFLYQDSMQPVTMPWLKKKGAEFCSFVRPGQKLTSKTGNVLNIGGLHGAFVFLFTRDPRTHDPRNRFFQVDDGQGRGTYTSGRVAGAEADKVRALASKLRSKVKDSMDQVQKQFGKTSELSAADFVSTMQKLKVGLSPGELETIFAEIDLNNDGNIKFGSFMG
eukprot:CAMPEP_0206556818 /NCGR_PEP_ID=MMETSP0325_2-20121206/18698_1 /ASSEMBLY_ACC=CAM_ASM_000347 /TAXON_ID=2866 /ORGANISM="Crypthecodinium cohnii, Strain Seligo" /LENGTH=673 /DNA_ID=CAMNT_0054057547 /DNA_START=40 /DNA_END=2057 /DNA_ORIENTATION=+